MKAPLLVLGLGAKHDESGPDHVDEEKNELDETGDGKDEFDAFFDAMKSDNKEEAYAAFMAAVEACSDHYRKEMDEE